LLFLYRFKDGKSFPWAKETSSMILHPGALNQSIYSRHISEIDAGKYTCVVKNDTHRMEHTIHLKVLRELIIS
jgi:interleukin 1 receptor accessory protein-like